MDAEKYLHSLQHTNHFTKNNIFSTSSDVQLNTLNVSKISTEQFVWKNSRRLPHFNFRRLTRLSPFKKQFWTHRDNFGKILFLLFLETGMSHFHTEKFEDLTEDCVG